LHAACSIAWQSARCLRCHLTAMPFAMQYWQTTHALCFCMWCNYVNKGQNSIAYQSNKLQDGLNMPLTSCHMHGRG